MYKLVITGDRAEGMSLDDVKEYYMEEHVPLVERMPNVQKFTVSFAVSEEDAECDYLAVLYYDDPSDIGPSLESEAGQAAVADVENFTDPDSGFNLTVEEHEIFDHT